MSLPPQVRRASPWALSLVGHALVFAAAMTWKYAPRNAPPPPRDGIDIEFVAPPRASAPTPVQPTPNQPEPVAPEPPRVRDHAAAAAHRVIDRAANPTQNTEPTNTNPEPPVGTVEPPNTQPTTTGTGTPASTGTILTAASLFNTNDTINAAAANAGGVDLGRPGSGYHASRDLFGRPRTGSRIDRIRDAAAGPTLAALAETNHMQAAGTSEHDARVSRRAAEEFNPVRTIGGLADAMRRAPFVGLTAVQHTATPGEAAMGSALDAAHGSSFTMGAVANTPPPPTRTLRADVEVDQDGTGAILATRVARSSGLASFDRAALTAIRAALPDAPPLNDNGRRSRWAFEVSEAAGAIGTILGGGNDGWRPVGDSADGMTLRFRVRRVASRPLQGS